MNYNNKTYIYILLDVTITTKTFVYIIWNLKIKAIGRYIIFFKCECTQSILDAHQCFGHELILKIYNP